MSDINADAAPAAWPVANAVAEGTPAPEAVAQVALQQELAEAGSAAPGEALPNGTPADSGTNPGSSGQASTESEAGNVVEAGSATSGEIVAVPAVDAPADTSAMTSASAAVSGEIPGAADLPRESHLLLLEHKLAAMHAKFMTGERIVIDEFEQILGHIKAVL